MKKLLGILVLGLVLTFSSNGISGEMNVFKKKIKLPKDVVQGYKNVVHFCCNFDKKTRLTPDYAFKIVNKFDDHLVRLGEQSIRFELRRGDCGVSPGGYNDCAHDSERHELNMQPPPGLSGVTWHTVSFFLDKNLPIHKNNYAFFNHMSIFQFHSDGDGAPGWNFSVEVNGLQLQRRTACNLTKSQHKKIVGHKKPGRCSMINAGNHTQFLMKSEDLLNQWHDVVLTVKWTTKQTGYMKMWINGKLVYHYQGSTKTPKELEQFQFGIYRQFHGNTPNVATSIVYYDEIRYAKKHCKKLNLENLGYSCKALEGQSVSRIDTIADGNNKGESKEQKIIKVLTVRIASKIAREVSNPNLKEIEKWVFKKLTTMDWDDNLEKLKDRRPTQERLLKNGIKEFAM